MIEVQLFIPAHNRPGTAYGPYLASILEQWISGFAEKGKDGELAYQKKQYVIDEIASLKSGLVADMGKSGAWTPVYSLAIIPGMGVGAFCKRGNASNPNKHKIELIISLPDVLRTHWPSPSPTSILFAEAALLAQNASAVLKLQTENADLTAFYKKVYGFEKKGASGQKDDMELDAAGIKALVERYPQGAKWRYARSLPAPS